MALHQDAGRSGLQGLISRWHPLVVVLAVGLRPQFLSTGAPSQGCLSVFVAWQLASLRMSHPREQGGSCMSLGTCMVPLGFL